MKNILLKVAYDGSDLFGWQKTKMGPSVEGVLETTLKQILNTEEVALQAASRTDRGVHANGQVVNFFTEKDMTSDQLMKSLNALLPKNITVIEASSAPLAFHPTLDAIEKTYHYFICQGAYQNPKNRFYSWHVPYLLNLSSMREAAKSFIGTHDFSSFCNMRKNMNYSDKIRQINGIEILSLDDNRIQFELRGKHFLYKMVRNLVGTLVYVGRGKISLETIPDILSAKKRCESGITAPAHGLFLHHVSFKDDFF